MQDSDSKSSSNNEGSYFDRVLERCRSYRHSLDQMLEEVDQEIDRIVADHATAVAPDSPEQLAIASGLNQPPQATRLLLPASIESIPGGPTPKNPGVDGQQEVTSNVSRGSLVPGGISGQLRAILTTAYVLCGRYELIKHVASSGCGVLFKSLDRRKLLFDEASPYVTIELLSERFQQCANWQALLQREATRLNQLVHPNIVRILDFQRDGSAVFVVMEYAKQFSLRDRLSNGSNGQLPRAEALRILTGIASGLNFAHSLGIVHGDLRPTSVLIDAAGNALVFDFGIASILACRQPVQGTADEIAYMSPEIAERAAPHALDDVYSYACICYELLTGTHPFDWRTAVEASALKLSVPRRDGLNWTQWKALQRALSFDEAKRTPSVAQLASEIAGWGLPSLSRFAERTWLDWLLGQPRSSPPVAVPHSESEDFSSRPDVPPVQALEHVPASVKTSSGSQRLG